MYKALVIALDDDSTEGFPYELFDDKDRASMLFNVKNYKTKDGVSEKIHRIPQRNLLYEVSGPLGQGLKINKSGLHLAFAAGTGILCFIDLVAHLVQCSLGIFPTLAKNEDTDISSSGQLSHTTNEMVQIESFKLVLYVSFTSFEDSIALDLLEAFDQYCSRNGVDCFSLHVRLAKQGVNNQKWDHEFVKKEIGQYDVEEIEKIYVCGPPVMNETFDRSLQEIAKDGKGLKRDQYIIL